MPSYFTSVDKAMATVNAGPYIANVAQYGWQGPEGALAFVVSCVDTSVVDDYFILTPVNDSRSLWSFHWCDVGDADVATVWTYLGVPKVKLRALMVDAFLTCETGIIYAGLMHKGLMISQGGTTIVITDDFWTCPRELHVWTGRDNGDYLVAPPVYVLNDKCEAGIPLTDDEWTVADAATMLVMKDSDDVPY